MTLSVLLKRVGMLSISRYLIQIINFSITVYIINKVGEEVFGQLSYFRTIVGYLIVATASGLLLYGTRKVASIKKLNLLPNVINEVVSARLLLFFLSLPVAFLLYALQETIVDKELFLLYLIQLPILVFTTEWFYYGREKYSIISVVRLLESIAYAVGVFVLFDIYSINAIPIALAIAAFIMVFLYVFLLKSPSQVNYRLNFKGRSRLIFTTFVLGGTSIASELLLTIDLIILKEYAGYFEVGVYRIAFQLVFLASAIKIIICQVYFPVMVKSHDKGEAITKILNKGLFYCFVIGLLFLSFFYVVGDLGLKVLYPNIASRNYIYDILIILAIAFIFDFLSTFIMFSLNAVGREKIALALLVAAVILKVFLNILLDSSYGAYGAAYSSLLCYVVLFIASVYVAYAYKKSFS